MHQQCQRCCRACRQVAWQQQVLLLPLGLAILCR
jgi:hypothetical protein